MSDTPETTEQTAEVGVNGAGGVNGAKASPELIRAALGQVYDPEIGIDIVSLGLVYDVELDDAGLLSIDMTLTSPYCPLGSVIQGQAHAVCAPQVSMAGEESLWNTCPTDVDPAAEGRFASLVR